MDYIYAPIPEPNKCRCGNSKHKDGLCDGSHLQESQETKDESTK
jgi:CDGSH-type Zn-finger protein